MSVMRCDLMKRYVPIAAVLFSCAAPAVNPDLCDLNQIVPIYGALGWNDARTELVEKPISPRLIPCACEIDPGLRAFRGRDPIADARDVYESGDQYFLGLPKLGTIVPGFSMDLQGIQSFPDVPTRQIPGSDEASDCFEREKLELEAEHYAVAYNTSLLRMILQKH